MNQFPIIIECQVPRPYDESHLVCGVCNCTGFDLGHCAKQSHCMCCFSGHLCTCVTRLQTAFPREEVETVLYHVKWQYPEHVSVVSSCCECVNKWKFLLHALSSKLPYCQKKIVVCKTNNWIENSSGLPTGKKMEAQNSFSPSSSPLLELFPWYYNFVQLAFVLWGFAIILLHVNMKSFSTI